MCEPTTIAAIGSYFSGTAAAASTGAAIITETAAGYTAFSSAAAAQAAYATAGLTAAQTAIMYGQAAGAGLSAYSAYQQASTNKAVAKNNAITAERAAQDALRRGEKDAQETMRRGALIKGTQRNIMAARGLDLSEGTPANLQDQTDFFTATDVATQRTNARRDAQGYRSQGANYSAEAAGYRPSLQAAGSLLSGATAVAERWQRWRG